MQWRGPPLNGVGVLRPVALAGPAVGVERLGVVLESPVAVEDPLGNHQLRALRNLAPAEGHPFGRLAVDRPRRRVESKRLVHDVLDLPQRLEVVGDGRAVADDFADFFGQRLPDFGATAQFVPRVGERRLRGCSESSAAVDGHLHVTFRLERLPGRQLYFVVLALELPVFQERREDQLRFEGG